MNRMMKTNRICRAVLFVLLLCLCIGPARNAHAGIIYYDAGKTKEVYATTTLNSTTTTWEAGKYYYVSSNLTISNKRVEVNGIVRLIIRDGATLSINYGIHVPSGSSLYIYGTSENGGTLNTGVQSQQSVGSIGGNKDETAGTVYIGSGHVIARGQNNGTAIGNGYGGSGAKVMITGGTVDASGSGSSAGLGGGYNGTVTITGGKVTATATDSEGIGIGYKSKTNATVRGEIVISGRTVTATSGSRSAGIGGSTYNGLVRIIISGGTVTAKSSNDAGIGGGYYHTAQPWITISGGEITATHTSSSSSSNGAGIGSGSGSSNGSDIKIQGGHIKAYANGNASAIGNGSELNSSGTNSYVSIEPQAGNQIAVKAGTAAPGQEIAGSPFRTSSDVTGSLKSTSARPVRYTEVTTIPLYTVTWKNDDGTVLAEEMVPKGETPVYSGDIPAKAPDGTKWYLFSGWTPAVAAVTGNTTYTATYTEKTAIQGMPEEITVYLLPEDTGNLPLEFLGAAAGSAYIEDYTAVRLATGDTIHWSLERVSGPEATVTLEDVSGEYEDEDRSACRLAVTGAPAAPGDAVMRLTAVSGRLSDSVEFTVHYVTADLTDFDGAAIQEKQHAGRGEQFSIHGEMPGGDQMATGMKLELVNGPEGVLTAYESGYNLENIYSISEVGSYELEMMITYHNIGFRGTAKVYIGLPMSEYTPVEGDTLTLPESLETIGQEAFRKTAEDRVVIPYGCTTTGPRAFADSPFLKEVTIPETVTEIDGTAFSGCENLEYIISDSPAVTEWAIEHNLILVIDEAVWGEG